MLRSFQQAVDNNSAMFLQKNLIRAGQVLCANHLNPVEVLKAYHILCSKLTEDHLKRNSKKVNFQKVKRSYKNHRTTKYSFMILKGFGKEPQGIETKVI